MHNLHIILLAAQVTATDLPSPPPHAVARQGAVVVLRPGERSCAAPLEVFGRRWRCRPDGTLIIGVAADAEPGMYVIGRGPHIAASLFVEEVAWPSERRPAPKPRPEPPGRREADAAARDGAYRAHTTERWSGYRLQMPLRMPIDADYRITDPFGFRRFYGKSSEPAIHTGTDIAAAKPGLWDAKAPDALAIAPGVVVLAQELWDSGNTVIVYHGDGAYTAYCHLARSAVGVGDLVAATARLGTIGGTVGGGRVGTHLHLVLRINGIPVDPLEGIATLNRTLYLNGLPR